VTTICASILMQDHEVHDLLSTYVSGQRVKNHQVKTRLPPCSIASRPVAAVMQAQVFGQCLQAAEQRGSSSVRRTRAKGCLRLWPPTLVAAWLSEDSVRLLIVMIVL
jgi:hypothetical protein